MAAAWESHYPLDNVEKCLPLSGRNGPKVLHLLLTYHMKIRGLFIGSNPYGGSLSGTFIAKGIDVIAIENGRVDQLKSKIPTALLATQAANLAYEFPDADHNQASQINLVQNRLVSL